MRTFGLFRLLAPALLATIAAALRATDVPWYADGEYSIYGSTDGPAATGDFAYIPDNAGIPAYYLGIQLNTYSYKKQLAYDRVPGTSSVPLTAVTYLPSTYVHAGYQMDNGTVMTQGTSVLAAPGYRPSSGGSYQFIPEVTRADVSLGGSYRWQTTLTARYKDAGGNIQANVSSLHQFPDQAVGKTVLPITVQFLAAQTFTLDSAYQGNDMFRFLTARGLYKSDSANTVSILRYEDAGGTVQTLTLTAATTRDAYLFSANTALGSWFELVRTTATSGTPENQIMRVTIKDKSGITGQLGIQAWLNTDTGTDPTKDNVFSVWVEWLNASISTAQAQSVSFEVSWRYEQTLTSMALSPASATTRQGFHVIMEARPLDQYNRIMDPPPTLSWATTAGSEIIPFQDRYTYFKSRHISTYTVTVTSGAFSAQSRIKVKKKRTWWQRFLGIG